LKETQDRYFRKFLNTSGYKPGDYIAEAVIDFGDIVKVNKTFRVGSLFVGVSNFTEQLQKGKIQEYIIGIESKWNGDLDEVFADVNIFNDVENITFRTPSVSLAAWESKNLVGFVDTEELEGEYDVNIILNYVGAKTFASGKLIVTVN